VDEVGAWIPISFQIRASANGFTDAPLAFADLTTAAPGRSGNGARSVRPAPARRLGRCCPGRPYPVSVFGRAYGEPVVCHPGDGRWLAVDSFVDRTTGDPIALRYPERLGAEQRREAAPHAAVTRITRGAAARPSAGGRDRIASRADKAWVVGAPGRRVRAKNPEFDAVVEASTVHGFADATGAIGHLCYRCRRGGR
jgi:hypothetical protein